MKKQRKNRPETLAARVLCCLKAALLGCALTAALVILLAFLLKWDLLDVSALRVCNTIIKSVSACLCGLVCAARLERNAGLFGSLAGLLYMALSYAVFSLFEQTFAFGLPFLSDGALGLICGFASAVLLRLIRGLRTQAA